MAVAILRSLLEQEGDGIDWVIESAGTWAEDGFPAAEFSQFTVKSYGQNLSKHRSRCITLEIAQQYDLILTMQASHKEALLAEWHVLNGKVFMLSEMAGIMQDVDDPYGGELEDFQDTAHLMERYLRKGLERIRELAVSKD
jgi:protein-tyrosine-phosphatase